VQITFFRCATMPNSGQQRRTCDTKYDGDGQSQARLAGRLQTVGMSNLLGLVLRLSCLFSTIGTMVISLASDVRGGDTQGLQCLYDIFVFSALLAHRIQPKGYPRLRKIDVERSENMGYLDQGPTHTVGLLDHSRPISCGR
jgi:hypothetical protein